MAFQTIATSSTGQIYQYSGTAWGLVLSGGYAAVNASRAGAGAVTMATVQTQGYGFSIPAGATINGIEVSFSTRSNIGGGSFGNNQPYQATIKVVSTLKTGTATNYDFPINGGYTTYTFGSPTDLWGTTWTDSDINAADFGVILSHRAPQAVFELNDGRFTDVTVYYTPAPPPATTVMVNREQSGIATISGGVQVNDFGIYENALYGSGVAGMTWFGDSSVVFTTVQTRTQLGNSRIQLVTQKTQSGNTRISNTVQQTQSGNARINLIRSGSVVFNGGFESYPAVNTAATNTASRWIDGTSAGSATTSYGWAIPGGVTPTNAAAQFDNSITHSGSSSMRVSTLTNTATLAISTFRINQPTVASLQTEGFRLEPNTRYTLSYWVKGNNLVTNSAFIDIREFSLAAATVTTTTSSKFGGTFNWTQTTISFTTQATTYWGGLILRNNLAGTISDVWYDDITLYGPNVAVGNANIIPPSVTTAQTQVGNANIIATTLRTQLGNTRIGVSTSRNQIGTTRIGIVTQKTQIGSANLVAATNRLQTGNASVLQSLSQVITGTASIIQLSSKDIVGNAYIYDSSVLLPAPGETGGYTSTIPITGAIQPASESDPSSYTSEDSTQGEYVPKAIDNPDSYGV